MLISLGLALYGYDIKKKLKYIIIATIIEAILVSISRNMIDQYHLRTLVNTLILFFVIMLIKIEPIKAFLASLSSMLILLLSEIILVFTVTNITQKSFEQLIENQWVQIFLPWPHIIILTIVAFYLSKKNFSLLKEEVIQKHMNITRTSGSIYLAALILFLILILGIINVGIISGGNYLGKFLHSEGIFVFTILIALDVYLMYKVIDKLFKINEQNNLIKAQEMYLANLEEIMDTLRTQRHDFINHVEVLYSLHNEQNYAAAIEYLERLIGDIGQVNSIIRIDNPPLGALLNSKRVIAETKGIKMELSVETALNKLSIDAYTLVKILGNLIDNSIDAVLESNNKYIEVEIEQLLNNYIINVFNTGPVIEKENLERIFTKGFTTKGGEHEGLGLATVKEIVERYGGEIKVKSNEEKGTTFTIILPVKRT